MRGPSTPTGGRPSATSSTAPEALASWPLLPVAAGHEARAAGPAPPLPVQEREAALVDGRTWEHVAAAGDGRHRHPLLALAASATWLPWSPAFTLPFCSRLPPLQVPAQRRPRGRRRGWRAGEGGGGRRDEQSLLSMLGRTASIFFLPTWLAADLQGIVI